MFCSPTPALGYRFDISTICCAFGTGSGRNKTESTIAKIATFTAMHAERVITTASTYPLLRARNRAAIFISQINLSTPSPISRETRNWRPQSASQFRVVSYVLQPAVLIVRLFGAGRYLVPGNAFSEFTSGRFV